MRVQAKVLKRPPSPQPPPSGQLSEQAPGLPPVCRRSRKVLQGGLGRSVGGAWGRFCAACAQRPIVNQRSRDHPEHHLPPGEAYVHGAKQQLQTAIRHFQRETWFVVARHLSFGTEYPAPPLYKLRQSPKLIRSLRLL